MLLHASSSFFRLVLVIQTALPPHRSDVAAMGRWTPHHWSAWAHTARYPKGEKHIPVPFICWFMYLCHIVIHGFRIYLVTVLIFYLLVIFDCSFSSHGSRATAPDIRIHQPRASCMHTQEYFCLNGCGNGRRRSKMQHVCLHSCHMLSQAGLTCLLCVVMLGCPALKCKIDGAECGNQSGQK